MTSPLHDAVVAYVAENRFPFPGQTDWPADYVTLTNRPRRMRSIPLEGGEHFPDIVIVTTRGEVREIGEVEEQPGEDCVSRWRACSQSADDLTESGARHFFLYVPAGREADAVALLDRHRISFAGVRGFAAGAGGAITIVPHVTRGDAKDHR
jgi:hypothetical protein